MDYPASVANVGLVNGKFANENPSAGIVGSLIPAEWGNAVTDELVAIIKAANLTPSEADSAQVLAAIRILSQRADARYAVDTGTATAYKAAFTPAITALATGMLLYVRAVNANTNAAPTFAPDKINPRAIVKGANKVLVPGDIPAGYLMALQYDATFDAWVLLNPATGISTVTSSNDNGYVDDSDKPISSGWLRRALTGLASSAGFFGIFGETGMIRLPVWLGSLIFQWGYVTTTAKTTATASFPVTFPNACYQVVATHDGPAVTASSGVVVAASGTTSQVTVGGRDIAGNSSGTIGVRYIAVGK